MVLPLIPLMLGGMAVSAGANLYTQYNQRKIYRAQAQAYKNLDSGYRKYLAGHGLTVNPDRAWSSYYGQYRSAQTNLENSYAGSVGTVGGTIGASAGLYRSFGNSSRWL